MRLMMHCAGTLGASICRELLAFFSAPKGNLLLTSLTSFASPPLQAAPKAAAPSSGVEFYGPDRVKFLGESLCYRVFRVMANRQHKGKSLAVAFRSVLLLPASIALLLAYAAAPRALHVLVPLPRSHAALSAPLPQHRLKSLAAAMSPLQAPSLRASPPPT